MSRFHCDVEPFCKVSGSADYPNPLQAELDMSTQSSRKTFVSLAVMMILSLDCPINHSYCRGDLITVLNAGFENASVGIRFNEFTFGAPAGWNRYDPGNLIGNGVGPNFYIGTVLPTPPDFFLNGAPEGDRIGIAFNFFGSGGLGEYGIRQTLSDTLQANSRYNLSVEIGNIASGVSQSGASFNLDGFPGYRIDLMAGNVVLATDNNSLAGAIPEGVFATSSLEFSTGGAHSQLGQLLSIRLVNLNRIDGAFPNAELEVDFDNVRLFVTAIPEPSTLGLLGLAGGFCVFYRHRAGGIRSNNLGPKT